jgi:hypothetical protein
MVQMMSPVATRFLLLIIYLGLSLLFWFQFVPPVPSSLVIFFSTVSGPPIMLVWGREALVPFCIASALFLFLLYRALLFTRRCRFYFAGALVVWLVSGLLCYAISI